MSVYTCTNCRFRFEASDPKKCPRCDSAEISEFKQRGKDGEAGAGAEGPQVYSASGMVYGDTKTAWQSFHNQQATVCPHCGGKEFENNWKRKEKTCKKCGEILPLPRRFS